MALKSAVCLIACLVGLSSATATPAAPPELATLTRIVEATDRAWTAADAEAFSDFFAEEATFRAGDNDLLRGKSAIRSFFRRSFAERSGDLRRVSRLVHVEMIRPQLAAVEMDVTLEQRQTGGTWAALTRWRNLALLLRQRAWRIIHFRAVPLSPQN